MAISRKLLNPGENVVIDTRTHPKALIWPLICLVLLLAVGNQFKAQIFAASVLCVALAVVLDLLLVGVQRLLTPWTRHAR